MWMTGFNLTPAPAGVTDGCGCRECAVSTRRISAGTEVGTVAYTLAEGPRTEADLLAKLRGGSGAMAGGLAELVGQELCVRENDTNRLAFPIFRSGDDAVLLGEAGAVMEPIVREIAEATSRTWTGNWRRWGTAVSGSDTRSGTRGSEAD